MRDSADDLESQLEQYLLCSANVMLVLEVVRETALPSWRLFSGAVYQTVWNALTNRPADYGIRDYDIAYFDDDLSEKAEVIHREKVLAKVPEEMRARVEIVNQARVHLWFQESFGRPYEALTDTDTALRRSLFTAHAVGVRLEQDDRISIAAPYGLNEIFDMRLKPNPEVGRIDAQAAKASEALKRWPELTIE